MHLGGTPSWKIQTQGERALLVTLVVVTLGAWIVTIYHAETMHSPMGTTRSEAVAGARPGTLVMTGPDRMPAARADDVVQLIATGLAGIEWSLTSLSAFVVSWTVMMMAMMFPAVAPLLLLYRAVAAHRQARGDAVVPTWVFAASYVLVWTTVGAGLWVLGHWLGDLAGNLGAPDRTIWAPLALGDTLLLAGLYQLTPLKQACLDHCRSPFVYLSRHWREGYDGALRLGMRHGLYCLGCCWALCLVLLAAGTMSLAWMLLLTLVIFAERVLPCGQHIGRIVGYLLLIFGAGVVIGTIAVPWLA
jgi:predicted metal-binding membrane protein